MTVKPLNVLIVDDELPLRQELRSFPWEACDAVLVGEASNGDDALRMCESCAPDLVITDITMPIMDGITLIREIRKRYPAIQIILLTCHSDFHYVQEALRLGALEYLLKVSMEDEELRQAISKVRSAIIKERNSQDNEKAGRRLIQAAAFGKLLHGHVLSSSDWQTIPLQEEGYCVLAGVVLNAPNAVYLAERHRVEQQLTEMERSDPSWLTWVSIREKEYFVLISMQHASQAVDQSFAGVVEIIAGLLQGEEGTPSPFITAQAIVSEPFKTREEFTQFLVDSAQWKEALFYDSLTESHVFTRRAQQLKDMTDKQTHEMNEILRKSSCSITSLVESLEENFAPWCQAQRIRPNQLKQRTLNWLMEWLKGQQGCELDSASMTQLLASQTLAQMIACLKRDIEAAESRKIGSRIEIRSAVQWIKDHMQQSISLTILADQVGLSPHYVSRLFREETGCSVNQYITRLRMEKAVELLKRTNKKVYEIAEEVGIPNYRYFTVTFRNWTGVSPTDYKRHV
ncbi:response regulator [Paenibacillus solisilvae]|uniref:Response regulator n=1 Tax=Paenibacillus solisilvae TaxID=2486751 RepID=A0ABW0VZJ6_9BACL